MLSILIQLAYNYWPSLYKKRFFKTLNSLKTKNFKCEPELLYLKKILKNDSIFIDIGTNKGIYIYQAEKVIKKGNIIGFEPNISMVNFAQKLFKTAKIYSLAISSKKGKSTLYVPKLNKGLQDTRGSLEEIKNNVEKYEIDTITLDEWVLENKISKIDVIKIDVEGHEFEVVIGCKSLIKKLRPIFIIEIELRHAKYEISTIFEIFKDNNYNCYYFDRKSLQTLLFDYNEISNYQKDEYLNNFNLYINNFIFIPNTI